MFEDLRTFILNRTVKEVTPGNFEEVPRESDLIAQISETRLQIFGAGGFTVVNPTIRKNAIAALQSIRLLLQTEITRDRKELVLSENFEASVERNILFTSVVKPG